MAKVIKYQFAAWEGAQGDAVCMEKTVSWNEGNEEIARREAVDGVYFIEEDGTPTPAATAEDVMNALLGVTV